MKLRTNSILLFLLFLFFLCLYSTPVKAVQTVFWKTETIKQWIEGKSDGVSVTTEGKVVLAPKLEEIFDTEDLYVWSLVIDNKNNIYIGTGNNGKIYRVSSAGDSTLFAELPELEIFALAINNKGEIFAGTSPGGIIYKITAPNDTTRFFETGEDYIWALKFDKGGNLLAATGSEGKLYRISPNGKGEIIYDSSEQHIMSLIDESTID